jgi:hypothetical protein
MSGPRIDLERSSVSGTHRRRCERVIGINGATVEIAHADDFETD